MNAFGLRLLIITLDKITDRLIAARRRNIEGAGVCRHGVLAWTVDGVLHHETGKSTAMRRVLARCDAGVIGMTTDPTLVVKKLVGVLPHDCAGGAGCTLPEFEHLRPTATPTATPPRAAASNDTERHE